MHPSTNRDQGIRDSGYLYWFYVLSCRVPAKSYLWKLQISPQKCHQHLIFSSVVNTGISGWSEPCYCTELHSFHCCHGTTPPCTGWREKRKKENPNCRKKSIRSYSIDYTFKIKSLQYYREYINDKNIYKYDDIAWQITISYSVCKVIEKQCH